MKANIRLVLLALLVAALSAVSTQAAEIASGGIYGGYVGSDRWFSEMRRSAANRAMLQSLAGKGSSKKLPADYVEFAGQIVFPEGNPFPKGQLPDLRISTSGKGADPVERAPHIDQDGSFYTVLKKGVTYDFYWMHYFGSREKFATLHVQQEGARQRKVSIEYRPSQSTTNAPSQKPAPSVEQPAPSVEQPAASVEQPAAGPGYVRPQTGEGYKSPEIGPGFRSPGSR